MHSNYDLNKVEVLVCDGLSEDSTVKIVLEYEQAHTGIKYLKNEDRFTPQALNLGMRSSSAEVKIILGAHAEIDTEYIRLCVKELNDRPEVGCVGGIIENIFENEDSELIGMAMSSPFGVGNAHFRTGTSSGYVDTVAFGAYRAEIFEQIGYFDEDLVRNQDDEINFRLVKSGWKIWLEPGIKSKYYVRSSIRKVTRQYYQYGYWKVFVNKKHKTVTSFRQIVPPAFVFWLIVAIPAAVIWPLARLGLLTGLLTYVFIGLFFAIRKSGRMTKAFHILVVFFILHTSYGLGYLWGIFRFSFLRKDPSKKSANLTR